MIFFLKFAFKFSLENLIPQIYIWIFMVEYLKFENDKKKSVLFGNILKSSKSREKISS